jgi:hypothetical protein
MTKLFELHNPAALKVELQEGIEQARTACELNGPVSAQCAAAWDVVEEIQSALSHSKSVEKSAFEVYCDQNPEADECRIYDV